MLAFSGSAAAQCCPSGGSGTPTGRAATTGLGEASPPTANLSTSSAWGVYQFERDGLTYLQINDAQGKVRAAVGSAGTMVWVMPMGTDADRVSIAATSAVGSIVYSSDDFTVRVLEGTSGVSWIVVPRTGN